MNRWERIQKVVKKRFGHEIEIDQLLFIIGLQESGLSPRSFSKEEKIQIYHIAVCSLLEPWGYYTFSGKDEEGWPHWELKKKLPPLTAAEQHRLMLEAIEDYFLRMGYFDDVIR
jgi:hypothetical protein